jgi:hypothetical protein
MKRIVAWATVPALLLLLTGCNLWYQMFPGFDPLEGPWNLTGIILPAGMGGDGTWHDPDDYGAEAMMIFTADREAYGEGTVSAAYTWNGTWDNDYGVYTITVTAATGAAAEGMFIATLSRDRKTLRLALLGDVFEEFTKED